MSNPRKSTRLRLEPLEARRTPATLGADGKTLTFTTPDGDLATVRFNKSVLNTDNADTVFKFDTGAVNGNNETRQQLQEINLTGLPNGLSVSVTAGGNAVDVGWLRADGVDVGAVTIAGDLGRITAGDAKTKTRAVKSLDVQSIGLAGLTTQAAGGSLDSVVAGAIGALTVARNVDAASLTVTGGTDGKIGKVTIGGDLAADPTVSNTGLIRAEGAIQKVSIAGDIVGGDGAESGVRAGSLGKVTIDGRLTGRAGNYSAAVVSATGIKSIAVGGALVGGDGQRSASILAQRGDIKAVTVTGDVGGGAGTYSGAITATGAIGKATVGSLTGDGKYSGAIFAGTRIAKVIIRGNVTGGGGVYSGAAGAPQGIQSITVDGSVVGGDGNNSASFVASSGNIGKVTIAGDLTGGTGAYSGSVDALSAYVNDKLVGGKLANVTIKGDLAGGDGRYSGMVRANDSVGAVDVRTLNGGGGYSSGSIIGLNGKITAVTVRGDVTGGDGEFSSSIWAGTKLGPVKILAENGMNGDLIGGAGKFSALIQGGDIQLISVAGSVTGGTGAGSASVQAGRNLKKVVVGGSWTGASIGAGVNPRIDGYFDTADDIRVAGKIGSILIKGTADGTDARVSAIDHFAFIATQIGKVSINGQAVPLKRGPTNDDIPLGTTGDFRLVELEPTP